MLTIQTTEWYSSEHVDVVPEKYGLSNQVAQRRRILPQKG
jgi:hypothetical protein